ncbi:CD276 antigen homolog isoform X2 [Alosa pseudoharengus]|uniref:CD276 antigen homolog isoform X2 n=1 Tax=Alosa pseudoharengus TaxID=34774 RepID=UPI003F8989F3
MRIDVRLHLIGLLFFLFEPVTLEVPVVGYVGGDVVLPCSHSGPDANVTLSDQDITFLWRFKDSVKVYNFVRGESVSDQHKQFENRATASAPKKGDFSLTLRNLSGSDHGEYTCFVPEVKKDLQSQHVLLTIKEKPAPEPKEGSPRNSSMKIGPQKTVLLLILMLIPGLISIVQ